MDEKMNAKEQFEKNFPNLKGKRIDIPDCQKCSEGLAFLSGVIEENCIDKEEVKFAIDAVTKDIDHLQAWRYRLYTILGLKDE